MEGQEAVQAVYRIEPGTYDDIQILITKFPSLKFPQSFSLLAESKNLMSNKKNTVLEERRKNIQQCLRDLAKI